MSQYMREGTGQEIVRALGGTPPQGNPAAAQALYVTEATGRAILAAIEAGGGGGGGSVVTYTQNVLSGLQIGAIRINGTLTRIYIPEPAVSVITNAATTLTLQPCPVTYKWGEAAELTLTVTATTQYHFMFSCPSSAATILTITGITGKTGDTTLEAGGTYEVDIWAGIAFIKKLEVEAVT